MATMTLPAVAPAVAASYGVSSSVIGYQISLLAAAMLFALAFGGNLSTRWGACRVQQVALALLVCGCAIATGPHVAFFFASAIILGLGYGLLTPSASHLLMRFTPSSRRNLLFSLKQTGVPLGGMLTRSDRAGDRKPLRLALVACTRRCVHGSSDRSHADPAQPVGRRQKSLGARRAESAGGHRDDLARSAPSLSLDRGRLPGRAANRHLHFHRRAVRRGSRLHARSLPERCSAPRRSPASRGAFSGVGSRTWSAIATRRSRCSARSCCAGRCFVFSSRPAGRSPPPALSSSCSAPPQRVGAGRSWPKSRASRRRARSAGQPAARSSSSNVGKLLGPMLMTNAYAFSGSYAAAFGLLALLAAARWPAC